MIARATFCPLTCILASAVSCGTDTIGTNPGTSLEAGQVTPDGATPANPPDNDLSARDGAPGVESDGTSSTEDGLTAADGGLGDEGSSETGSDASVAIQGGVAGEPCNLDGDCASGLCSGNVCTDATSCLTLLQARPSSANREYEIDPDGVDGGLSPFNVYCDMTADGGGWTLLPLRFSDGNYWSIATAGDACITIDMQDSDGNYRQYQSTTDGAFAYSYLKFLPPIEMSSVRLVNFYHTNGGSNNTMDFVIGGVPTSATPSLEGWYFADPSTTNPVGYAFPTAAYCPPPYELYAGDTCSRDYLTNNNAPTAPFPYSETVTLSATVGGFEMVLMQGCFSVPITPLETCELFQIATPPGTDGVWTNGIAVR